VATLTPPQAASDFCTSCGTALAFAQKFCQSCGAKRGGADPAQAVSLHAYRCSACGGDGAKFPLQEVFCPQCRWLRPLGAGYDLPVEAFLWRLDAEAMMRLRSLGPVTAAVHHITERYGRPWFEASVNGVRLSQRQMPDIFSAAVRAARTVGLSRMPEIYVSGEQMWDAKTLGTDSYAFVVLGSVLTNFKADDLAFVLAREMGRVRAGHAVWRTAFELLMGRRQAQRTIMADGMMQFLNPGKIVESAFDAPLMAWARHSEITADRAGQLAIGKLDVARRVLLQWTLKSFPLFPRINIEEWAEQEEEGEDPVVASVEAMMSSTPFIGRRLKVARTFHESEDMKGWRAVIEHFEREDGRLRPQKQAVEPAVKPVSAPTTTPPDTVRLTCAACAEPMRVKRALLVSEKPVNVRCPNAKCGKVLSVTPRRPAAPRPDQTGD
jgi:Zn-dependent protease with chaperone function